PTSSSIVVATGSLSLTTMLSSRTSISHPGSRPIQVRNNERGRCLQLPGAANPTQPHYLSGVCEFRALAEMRRAAPCGIDIFDPGRIGDDRLGRKRAGQAVEGRCARAIVRGENVNAPKRQRLVA